MSHNPQDFEVFGPALSVLWPPCARGLQPTCTIHFLPEMREGHLSSIYTRHGTESDEGLFFLVSTTHDTWQWQQQLGQITWVQCLCIQSATIRTAAMRLGMWCLPSHEAHNVRATV
ncbi:hypothetical protein CVIRNUC_001876 [Coccomyxa viridis]|uniref:Uncharacterized protein n=1 Tax=Coccomyxa viridis TaxID=1274662 RepID=A0AAV1HWW4_9CHLO|nr:hypothetical protein CVIRNUC_001876 [Coccomyxa viridis]